MLDPLSSLILPLMTCLPPQPPPTLTPLPPPPSPQLWNVCYKSQWARVEIPELEFELSQDGKKHIDSIYNHLAGAVYNLGAHISGPGGMMSDDSKCKISECLGQVSVEDQFVGSFLKLVQVSLDAWIACLPRLCGLTRYPLPPRRSSTSFSSLHAPTPLQLNLLLDLQQPWTWVLYDPSGTSSFHHMDKVLVEPYEEEE